MVGSTAYIAPDGWPASEWSVVKVMTGTNADQPNDVTELLRKWARGFRLTEGLKEGQTVEQLYEDIHPCLTISRETGAGASYVAQRIGEKLGFDTVDRELIEALAERHNLPRDMLEIVDERVCNVLRESIGIWLGHRMLSQSEYLSMLCRYMLLASTNASTIFVGHGAQFILPRKKCLALRIIAPFESRVARIMARQQLNRDEAERYARQRDAARGEFVRRHFRSNVEDAHLYDMVINTENIELDDVIEMIIAQWQKRFPA
jgi:cytidylate kinase